MRYVRIIFLVLMFFCVIYAVSIYMVGSGTFSFMIWAAATAFFGLAFFFSGNGRWMKVPAAARWISCCLIVAVLASMTMCFAAMISHFGDKGERNLDYIVVPGAQMKGQDPSTIYKFRLDAAYEYLSENPGTICIVSGARGSNESISEGEGGKSYLESKGIAPDRIIAENRAVNTTENIACSLEIIEQEESSENKFRIGIVTNNFHVFRSVHLAKNLTDDEICGVAAYTIPWYLPNNMVRECFGIVRDLSNMKY